MKKTNILCVIFILICSACSTLIITEIQSLNKHDFDSLILKPGIEPNELRIDVIRQTYEQNVTDSTKETKDSPYNPLGFDLGNGLFYDLNGNLSFKINYLLNYSSDSDFEVEIINRPSKNKGIIKYSFCNDSLRISYPPKDKIYNKFNRTRQGDSISFNYKNKLNPHCNLRVAKA
jgi:hypothetical protein